MDELLAQAMTRRRMMQMAAGGAAAAGLAPLLGAAPASARSSAGNIKMWWWGQQEAVGIQSWMNDTISKFKAQTGSSVSPTLMDTAQVIPQFTKAAAAGNVPDVQFLFNGIYHMENVWLNYLKPLEGLVSAATIKNGGGTKLSQYAGKNYRTGFYALAFGVQYNKEHFDKAGLNADSPPKTWDAFLNCCDKLKSKGYIPLGGGVKDGFLGEWWLINSLTQNLNTAADALNLFIGKLDWREPKYHEHWIKLQELHDNKFWNDDATSLEPARMSTTERVIGIAADPRTTGADDIVVCDTIGQAIPAQVTDLIAGLNARTPQRRIVFHGHDTWGLGVANTLAAIDAGATMVDGSLGGLGGCPFAPGASGNTSSEDLLFATRPDWFTPAALASMVDITDKVLAELGEPNRSRTAQGARSKAKAFDWVIGNDRGE